MPYISPAKQRRKELDDGWHPGTAGELNYVIHSKIDDFLDAQTPAKVGYNELNNIIGVLVCVILELYRRLGSDYEDLKIDENGDIPLYQRWTGVFMDTRKPWDDVG